MELQARDWIALATFIVLLIVNSFAMAKYIAGRMEKREEQREARFQEAVRDRNTQLAEIRRENGVAKAWAQGELARVDKDVMNLRSDINVQLAKIPTRDAMEAILSARVGPLEQSMQSLVIELARLGLHNPPSSRHMGGQ